jgi:V8-like Glu-specific endopeptidase
MRNVRILGGLAASVGLGVALLGGRVDAQQPGPASSGAAANAEAQAVLDYWTPEQMASAIPLPVPVRDGIALTARQNAPMTDGMAGHVNGWQPGSGPYVEVRESFPQEAQAAPQAFGTAPTNPLSGPYGPFQRWTMQGSYTPFPRSAHGKLFFTLNGGNFVCSGTVAGRSTVITAGHCVSSGSATWATNVLFCPSYYELGQFPGRGCWSGVSMVTSNQWHNSGDPDYDYACIVTATTGNVVANKIGNVTGWVGRAWNWNDVPEVTFGYPAAAPFPGNIIQQTVSVDWYDVDFTAGGPASKVIGSDLTGGSSGGGWFLSWRAPGGEVVDTDGNSATDPANTSGPHINGVNSHKRCTGGSCASPPTATAGVFWQEMTSPRFRLSDTDNNDSEDVFAICLANANNNP